MEVVCFFLHFYHIYFSSSWCAVLSIIQNTLNMQHCPVHANLWIECLDNLITCSIILHCLDETLCKINRFTVEVLQWKICVSHTLLPLKAASGQLSLWRNFLLQWDHSLLERVAIYHSPKWKHSLDTNVFFFLCLITEGKSEKEMSKQWNSGV